MPSTDERLDRIVEAVQRINVNLENLRVSLSGLIETCEDQERRLRSIERWKHHLTPILAAVTFIVGAVFTQVLRSYL